MEVNIEKKRNNGEEIEIGRDELYSYNHDLSSSTNEDEKSNSLYINNIIERYLGGDNGVSDKWFTEYSVLATTIDPGRNGNDIKKEGTLKCYSFIKSEDKTFRDNIQKFISPIILGLKEKKGNENWWFHNPETFLAPSTINPYVSYTDRNINIEEGTIKEKIQEIDEGVYCSCSDRDDFYYSSLDYSRSFSDILSYSKIICESYKGTENFNEELIKHYHDGVKEARSYYDYYVGKKDETYAYLTFPIVAAHARCIIPDIYKKAYGDDFLNGRYQGLGHCFIYFNIKKPDKLDEDNLKSKIKKIFIEINSTLRNFAFNYTFNLGLQLQEAARKETIKSAKAAIMSRNMSHNIGSHVMAYLKNDLRNVPSIFASSVLYNLFPQQFREDISSIIDNVELPFLVGLGSFIGYLQERQDYIATIASSYIPSFSPVNFKDSIYDELNPDLRFERHHGNDPHNHNRPQNILLSYIAKSERLSRLKTDGSQEHDILLGYKSGDKLFGLDSFSNNSDDEALLLMRQLNFALPGGIVGRQAIFSIIENIIRNAAKHNNVQSNLNLIFESIDGEDLKKDSDKFRQSISDDNLRNVYAWSSDIEDIAILSITDNQECSEETITKLRRALRQPYIGKDAQTNKGIKEIRISATWLRGEDDDSIFAMCPLAADECDESVNKKLRAPVVAVERSEEGNLRYFIGLRKTYEFALVYHVDKCRFESRFQIEEGKYKTISIDNIIKSDTCYEYIVAENADVYNQIRPYVTNRCINAEDIVQLDSTSKITPEIIYKAYTGINENSPCIIIEDDKIGDIEYGQKIKRGMVEFALVYETKGNVEVDNAKRSEFESKFQLENGSFEMVSTDAIKNTDICYEYIVAENADVYNQIRPYVTNRCINAEDIVQLDSTSKITPEKIYKKLPNVPDDYCMYRSHHFNAVDFGAYWIDRANGTFKYKIKYIDGITGDNSSDRLVRREVLDKKWYTGHLYAMQSPVAIFDERLFQIIHGLNESQMIEGTYAATDLVNKCKKNIWPESIIDNDKLSDGKLNDEMYYKLNNIARSQLKIYAYSEIQDFIELCESYSSDTPQKGKLIEFIDKYRFKMKDNIMGSDHHTAAYAEKGVHIYTIIPMGNKECIIVGNSSYDYSVTTGNEKSREEPVYQFKFEPIARIWQSSDGKFQMNKLKGFKYISIHQGLIDKMYSEFGIEGTDEIRKKELIHTLYNGFMSATDEKELKGFLPRLTIHSGRGRVTSKDMPMNQPFIQYSAIEHAVLDCKYSLVELLDFAKYKVI